MDQLKQLQEKIEKLEREVRNLRQRRIYQDDVVPAAIKNRHLGEANSYVFCGLAADRPTEGTLIQPFTTSIYFATDTGVLSIWNGTAWLSETFA